MRRAWDTRIAALEALTGKREVRYAFPVNPWPDITVEEWSRRAIAYHAKAQSEGYAAALTWWRAQPWSCEGAPGNTVADS